ncbi:MAG: VOC family protein [Planctomycetota bacterium]|jgi:uncharacterized glyoxalase superfamily protein PhnB
MTGKVNPIPEGFHTLTPHIIVKNGTDAIEFYKKAFNAEVIELMPGPDGKGVMHAELKIGDSFVMLAEEYPAGTSRSPQTLNGTSVVLHLYVKDVDASYDQAVKAGADATMPAMDTFWGDRYGRVCDPFGHEWSIATHKEDLTAEEIGKRAKEYFANMGGEGCAGQS